jgi:hypothetical protein
MKVWKTSDGTSLGKQNGMMKFRKFWKRLLTQTKVETSFTTTKIAPFYGTAPSKFTSPSLEETTIAAGRCVLDSKLNIFC